MMLPMLFSFFVMGFCDLVGIATSHVKQDFNWSETPADFIPSIWSKVRSTRSESRLR